MSDSCPRCGHSFNNNSLPGRDGYCHWCVHEQDNPEHCHVCGEIATCSSSNGYLCDSEFCHKKDEEKSTENQWQEHYEENYSEEDDF